MKAFYFCFLLVFLQSGFSQSPVVFENSFTEKTTDQEKFTMYVDSMQKYLYRDIVVVESAMNECQTLIEQKATLSDSILFEFAIEKIYLMHSMAKPLEAYRIIADCESMLDRISISHKKKGTFYYIKGFTYMAIGDLEAAQKAYYENIELAEMNKDTSTMVHSFYSLGQLFNDESDFVAARKSFQKILDFSKTIKIRPSTLTLVNIELSESFSRIDQYDKALQKLETAYKIADEGNLQVLKSDILIHIGDIYIAENKIDSAQQIYDQLLKSNEGSQDQYIINDTQKFLAHLHQAQKKYPQALAIYKNMLDEIDETNIDALMDVYSSAHEVCKDMNDFETAYDYLLAFNKLKKQRDEDVHKQKTSYLKIKFESEQKEKENDLLSAKVLQNQTESKLLYLWLVLSFVLLVVFIGAFYQKGRYSKKLEVEVLKRTINLKKSNDLLNRSSKELEEFNRILSHDLKEPLRSIVGFSQLVSKETVGNSKAQEYLKFVMTSGKQLHQLIESVNIFQNTNTISKTEISKINSHNLFDDILLNSQLNFPDKKINFSSNFNSSIHSSLEVLKFVFQVIVDNAARYNEQKSVNVFISYYSKNKNHFFEIKDNGIGIADEYHEQIFEMFRRLNNKKDYTGSGMGLSSAARMIKKIDGKISILQSQENRGSTFLVTFPESTEIQNTIPELVKH